VLSGWGQFSSGWDLGQPAGKGDADDLEAYRKAVAPHAPAMISFYVAPDSMILTGFLRHYREFTTTNGFFIAQIGFYFRGKESDVATGMLDPQLYVLGDGLRDIGRPVLLRIGYEFNNPGALYQPSAYIGAFRHTVQVFRQDRVNFAAVWDGSAREFFSDPKYMKWYPGDDVVDWWGLDVSNLREFSDVASKAFLQDAARHRKPVIINGSPAFAKSEAEALKWYAAFFDFIRSNPAIKAFGIHPTMRLTRWIKAGAYVKQQLADPRFIDASEAPAIFRRAMPEP
jgi:hypothetical protein